MDAVVDEYGATTLDDQVPLDNIYNIDEMGLMWMLKCISDLISMIILL